MSDEPQFVQKVAGTDLRVSLEALRDRLAAEIEAADSSGAVASLAKQLHDVLVRLAGLPSEEASSVDEIAARRKRRRTAGPSDGTASG